MHTHFLIPQQIGLFNKEVYYKEIYDEELVIKNKYKTN